MAARARAQTRPTGGARRTSRRKLTPGNVAAVPKGPGVYVLLGARGSVVYVGKARSLHARLSEQLDTGRFPAVWFSYIPTTTEAKATQLERILLARWQPRFNVHRAS